MGSWLATRRSGIHSETVQEMKEIKIEDDHIREARIFGAVCIKGKIEGRAAFPDQLILKPNGKFYWVEFKSDTGTLQDDQIEMHLVLRTKGHTIYVCYSEFNSLAILDEEFRR